MTESTRVTAGVWWIGGMLLALLAWFGWPLLHPDYVGHDADALLLFLPLARFAREELLAGRLPLWNPSKFIGAPLLANLILPVFYPPQAVGLLLPQPFGMHLLAVLHAGWAALGGWVMARRVFGCGTAGAALAGFTFAASAPVALAMGHPNQHFATAWLPWIGWAGWRLLGEHRSGGRPRCLG